MADQKSEQINYLLGKARQYEEAAKDPLRGNRQLENVITCLSEAEILYRAAEAKGAEVDVDAKRCYNLQTAARDKLYGK